MKKKEIDNKFFDLIAFTLSISVNFFRSLKNFFILNELRRNIFFNFLDFLFRVWPKYFWEKPTLYKITSFLGDIFNNIFKKK